MPKFVTLDADNSFENGTRPVIVNIGAIAFVMASGTVYSPDSGAAIYFVGGMRQPNERLIVKQTVAEVAAAIEAASA